jgi:hypothetical protein
MSKRYIPVKGTGGTLFTRLAADEVNNTAEFAQHILAFVADKISEQDLAQLRKMLMGEEGAQDDPPDFKGKPLTGGGMAGDNFPQGLRCRLDAAPATTSARGGFDARFPSARRIKTDDMIGRR